MKTSLNIDDLIFYAAKKEALKNRTTLSATINAWARIGFKTLRHRKSAKKKAPPKPVNLGGPAKINLNSRAVWMDQLD